MRRALLFASLLIAAVANISTADEPLPKQAENALRRAVEFYHKQVASHGGYVYRYSADLKKQEGEGETTRDTVWVQPPGTPAVGLAYVDAYDRLGDPWLLDAAKSAGECLVQGQLRSGGWQAHIDFGAELRGKMAYRVDPPRRRARNSTSFDDDKTQSAMRFMMRLDQALGFKDERIHESIQFALDAVCRAQFPNGAWAQVFDSSPEPDKYPVKRASYPESVPAKYPGGDYWVFYTFNDNAIADTIHMLLLASRIYKEPRYRQAALRAGEFIILAQMPDPQPAWAQQYNFDMHPCWARKFEPPAISGGESQGLVQTLLDLYVETGDRKFLQPVPRALDYLRKSQLPNGQLARFNELKTNKPLYITKTYELTYDDSDLPTHYGFKVSSKVEALMKQYDKTSSLKSDALAEMRERPFQVSRGVPNDNQVRSVIQALDERGAWVEDGTLKYHGKGDDTRRIIDSATFIRNIDILSRYVAGQRGRKTAAQ